MMKLIQKARPQVRHSIAIACGLGIISPAYALDIAVPEPNIIFLMGAGVVGLILAVRYKGRK